MKNFNFKFGSLFSLLIIILSTPFSIGQTWTFVDPVGNGDIGYTTSTVTGIGIGTFAGNLGAVLHVNSSLTTAQTGSGAFATSEVFRTQVPSSTASNYRMFRGTDEMANFWFGSGANSLNITSTRGAFRITTGNTSNSTTESFEIVGGTGSDRGWIGIGDWDNFNPNVDLHIHGGTTSDFGIQLTNGTVGTSTTDGLRLIMNNSGRATMYNWEDDDIAFGTGNSGGGGSIIERVIIHNTL